MAAAPPVHLSRVEPSLKTNRPIQPRDGAGLAVSAIIPNWNLARWTARSSISVFEQQMQSTTISRDPDDER